MSSIAPLAAANRRIDAPAFKVYTHRQMGKITQLDKLPQSLRFEMQVVASVLPFRVNDYVLNELIDWDNVPDDPMFRLVFPQRDMLQPEQFERIADLITADVPASEFRQAVDQVRASMNPHPAGQMELNVPEMDGDRLAGMQHKYDETVLFFPGQGQVCHSYCTFCFRWAQFVGDKELRFAAKESEQLLAYLQQHKEVSDLLLTGGDPMVMKASNLKPYLEGLLSPELDHVQTLRIGTKSLTFWPHRFISDPDASQLLKQFEALVNAGKHVAVMAHYNHWRELDTAAAQEAVRLVRSTGAEIRSQGPLLANINDDADVWSNLWREQAKLGIIPYYMFVERDTGAQHYFAVPLARAWHIYRDAMLKVSGLGRTARGPSMSAGPGKVEVQGVTEVQGEKVFVLRFIQGRNKDWVQRPFFAKYDENATWLDQLKPAFGEGRFFFEDEYRAMLDC
ncbi:MAG: lysine 2,3-aminomutase [Gammaproteobacteria bacterium]|jgi:KamA family protein